MADPFEVRVRFSSQLQNLNASVTSAQKAAVYALKYKDMDEDLHSCILEQLEKTALNTRANIMYFIEPFLELAQREGHLAYIHMIQRDIIRVVDAVAPESGQGAANVKVVRKVLRGLQEHGFLERQAVIEIEEVLKERESDMSSPANGVGKATAGGVGGGHYGDAMDVDGHMPPSQTIPSSRNGRHGGGAAGSGGAGFGSSGGGDGSTHGAPRRLDKRQIEERIEEDRERHKRLRENIWAVPKGTDAEMWKIWDETSDLGEDDHLMGEEEEAEREQCVRMSCAHRDADLGVPAGSNGKTAR